ncbi:MAG: phosphomethylpyrimidine kinase [Methanomicrobiales archaeon]|jgi:hydroxymethylpyrimidine/phosphomethylpyrimidine kinase|nr:phosphomethylpyrimidine kinase [Methanomicrobiales archaeon]
MGDYNAEEVAILSALASAVRALTDSMDSRLIPDAGTNIAYAKQKARMPSDVAAVQGRIVRLGGRVHPVGDVAFGASDHVARIVLSAMRHDPLVRCAANIRNCVPAVQSLTDMFFEVGEFDRAREPPGITTMDWGTDFCCRDGVPDAIIDHGAVGKEAMIRILGEDPEDVVKKINNLSTRIKRAR